MLRVAAGGQPPFSCQLLRAIAEFSRPMLDSILTSDLAGTTRTPSAVPRGPDPVASSEFNLEETHMPPSLGTAPADPSAGRRSSVASVCRADSEPELRDPTQDGSATAIVYCEGSFGALDGKTANGLVRHSQLYEIVSIIDSEKCGLDSGMVLGDEPNGIPIHEDLTHALALIGFVPGYFIFGMAPASGMLSERERVVLLDAIGRGMNVVNGLHEFLSDDPEFMAASSASNVKIVDVRKPRDKKDLRMFCDRIVEVACPRIVVLGTDCAIGKRTTATIMTRSLEDRGLKAVMVGTGQTGLMQGARYGVALDAIPSQFCAGEMEAAIIGAFEGENPDVIIIEGQGALSHPAFSTTSFILRGSRPHAVVLQHAPGRPHRCDFEHMPMPTLASEIHLIQTFSDTKVIGVTLNHEDMTQDEIRAAIVLHELELGIPVTDALMESPDRLVNMVLAAFPELGRTLAARGR